MNRTELNTLNLESVRNFVQSLIDANKLHDFYICSAWLKLRAEVLEEHKSECQHCKQKGFYKKADTVHHVQYVRKHPELALSKTYIYKGIEHKNLIPLCHDCHERTHDYRRKNIKKPLTEERW